MKKSKMGFVPSLLLLALALALVMLVAVACRGSGAVEIAPPEGSAAHEGPGEGERTKERATESPATHQAEEIAPIETSTRPEGQAEEGRTEDMAPAASPTLEGLTFEEFRSTTPPAPLYLEVTRSQEGVRLEWEPAPMPDMAHGYSDAILHYNVYRRIGGEDQSLLATVSQTYYVDSTVEEGLIYHYAVSAVHEGPVEGERTEEVTFP